MMDIIYPRVNERWLVRPHTPVCKVECTQELGIFGTFLVDKQNSRFENSTVGHVVRSKLKDVDEEGILAAVKTGFATTGFDSLHLVDMEKCTKRDCKYAGED